MPLGFGRNGNDIVIPYGFNIISGKNNLDYSVYKNNSIIGKASLYKEYSIAGDKNEIKFSLVIPKLSKKNVRINIQILHLVA